MNKKTKRIAAATSIALISALTLAGCYSKPTDLAEREAAQDATASTTSLELENLKEKREREDDPDAIRYLYVMSFGQIVGYYVTKGKISSNGSQMGPEQEAIIAYKPNTGVTSEWVTLDSAQDDGSYGAGDPGIFFFTTDGVMVVTSLDYIQSDAPLAIDVPRLGG